MEVLLTVALVAVLGLIFSNLFRNAGESAQNRSSRDGAEVTNTEILNLLKRDYKFRESSNVNSKHNLTLVRKQFFHGLKADETYPVSYLSQCKKIASFPLPGRRLLEKVYSKLSSSLPSESRCFQSMKCSSDEYPQASIQVKSGANIPKYHVTNFPAPQEGTNVTSLGTALCFEAQDQKLQVIVETLYIQNSTAGAANLKADEIMLSFPFQNIEILPKQGD